MNKSMYCSLDAAKKLKELGIVQKADAWYYEIYNSRPSTDLITDEPTSEPEVELVYGYENIPDKKSYRCWKGMYEENLSEYAAFSVGELGLMLKGWDVPQYIPAEYSKTGKDSYDVPLTQDEYETEADARAATIITILKHHNNAQDINQRYEESLN